ncbi:MAG: adenylosuccinate lyase [Bacteroidia bacterium]|nr:adenylosuccinate lyase [Bacteroidia bacterium]MCO5254422.1 adenylosuccinate lyase [Bacteroidota bacterium]MCZ2129012.1 adenylosuccinate lyase [Bacteroidia bacterium]
MNINALNAISPIDGRYWDKCNEIAPYFSEFALIKYRVRVEIEYFIKLSDFIPEHFASKITLEQRTTLRKIYEDFSESDALSVKEIEKTTNHDVKAVEYFIKNKISGTALETHKEWIHFGLTSQDINNTAIPLATKEAWENVVLPEMNAVIHNLDALAKEWSDIPMLAKTHGQPASPTLLGKEIKVFVERVKGQIALCQQIPFSAKFGGATGNLNAHFVTFPDKDWISFAKDFTENTLGLSRTRYTTQIEPYDNAAAFFDANKRINNIFIDLSRDFWTYISMHYFTQKIKAGEIGSSAMPHKVNPIDFENAEGNLGMANAILEHLAAKLPISRLQRDLTDSTVLRNVGVPLAHGIIAYKSLLKGLDKLQLHRQTIDNDLEDNLVVVAEAIQNILRVIGYPNPYETLKELTRNNEKLTREKLDIFIDGLDVSADIKTRLKKITPFNYTGNN